MKILNKIHEGSFRDKIFLLLAVGSTLTVFLLTAIWLTYAWYTVEKTVERDLQTIAVRASGEIDQFLAGKTDTLMAMKELLSDPKDEPDKLDLMLRGVGPSFEQFRQIAIYNVSNELVASKLINGESKLPIDILNIALKGEVYRSPMIIEEDGPYLRLAIPMLWRGKIIRILFAEINVLHVWNKVDEIRVGKTGRASILSSEGIFLADPLKQRVLKMQRWRDVYSSDRSPDGKSGIFHAMDQSGTSFDVAWSAIPSTGWKLVITQKRNESMYFIFVMLFNAVTIILVCIVAAYYASAFLSRRLSKPIEELGKGVDEISKGDLKYRVPALAGREMKSLGIHLNEMALALGDKEKTKEKMAELEKLAAIGRLSEEVAHEINNPLSIMLNYIFIIKRDMKKLDAPIRVALDVVMDEIERISRIIDAFRELYKGSRDVHLEEVDPLLPLRSVLALCKMEMEERGMTIEEEIEEVGMVMADSDKLRQVFLNFIKNAMEATPDSGAIRVKAIKHDGQVEIDISDTGMGIKKEHLKQIFEPFFSTKGVKGTGLGLSVSYGMIKSFNGEIEVESEEGKGSNFKIILPAIEKKVGRKRRRTKKTRR